MGNILIFCRRLWKAIADKDYFMPLKKYIDILVDKN